MFRQLLKVDPLVALQAFPNLLLPLLRRDIARAIREHLMQFVELDNLCVNFNIFYSAIRRGMTMLCSGSFVTMPIV